MMVSVIFRLPTDPDRSDVGKWRAQTCSTSALKKLRARNTSSHLKEDLTLTLTHTVQCGYWDKAMHEDLYNQETILCIFWVCTWWNINSSNKTVIIWFTSSNEKVHVWKMLYIRLLFTIIINISISSSIVIIIVITIFTSISIVKYLHMACILSCTFPIPSYIVTVVVLVVFLLLFLSVSLSLSSLNLTYQLWPPRSYNQKS